MTEFRHHDSERTEGGVLMKAMISICMGILIIGITATAVQSDAMGIVGAWLFNEGSGGVVNDSVGNNNGTIEGNLEWTVGKFGGGLEFAGAGDSYVSIPHQAVLDSDPYTITAWVKLEGNGQYQYIAWKNGLVWPETHAKRHIDIWVMNTGSVVIMWSFEGGGANYGRVDGAAVIGDGEWHHVAKSCDGDTMRLHIDGVLDNEGPVGGALAENGEDPLWIGARPGNVAATGVIDEVGFFTEALSENQLASVMNDGLESMAAVEPSGKLAATWGKLKMSL